MTHNAFGTRVDFEFDNFADEHHGCPCSFTGFDTGRTWNGFPVIYVEAEMRNRIINRARIEHEDELAEDLEGAPMAESGMFSLEGWCVRLVDGCEGEDP